MTEGNAWKVPVYIVEGRKLVRYSKTKGGSAWEVPVCSTVDKRHICLAKWLAAANGTVPPKFEMLSERAQAK